MKTPNSLEPPRLATWLLERFSPVEKNPAVAGDLIEAFKQGRSPGWYWRQVFWVIVMASLNLSRKQWVSLAYAVGCGGLIAAARFWWSQRFYASYRISWPWSLVYQIAFATAFQAVIVTFALGAYVACSRNLRTRNLLRGLAVAFVALGSGNVALPFLTVALSSMLSRSTIVIAGVRLTYGWLVLVATPGIVALLLGMWQANRRDVPA